MGFFLYNALCPKKVAEKWRNSLFVPQSELKEPVARLKTVKSPKRTGREESMPKGQRVDPYSNFRFHVEIDGIRQAGFMECTGLGSQVEVVEYREVATRPRFASWRGGFLTGYCSEMGHHRLAGALSVAFTGDPRKPSEEEWVRRASGLPGKREAALELLQCLAEQVDRSNPQRQRERRGDRGADAYLRAPGASLVDAAPRLHALVRH